MTHTCTVQRNDGTPVANNVPICKSRDTLQFTPQGYLLIAVVLADPVPPGGTLLFKPGDVLRLSNSPEESPYTVVNVEDRSGSVLPDVRLLVRGQGVFS